MEYRIKLDDETLVVHTLSKLMGFVDEYDDDRILQHCYNHLDDFVVWMKAVEPSKGELLAESLEFVRKNGVKCLTLLLSAAEKSSAEPRYEMPNIVLENEHLDDSESIDDVVLPNGLKIVLLGDPDYGMPCFKL